MEPVRFDSTFDDFVDGQRRLRRGLPAIRKMRQRETFTTTTLAVVVAVAASLLGEETSLGRSVTVAVTTLVLMRVAYPRFWDWWVDRRTRAYLRDTLPSMGRIPTEVTLDESGVHAKSPVADMTIPWARVRGITDTSDGIEIVGTGEIVMVRARAFDTPEARAAFLEEARKHAGAGTLSGTHGTS